MPHQPVIYHPKVPLSRNKAAATMHLAGISSLWVMWRQKDTSRGPIRLTSRDATDEGQTVVILQYSLHYTLFHSFALIIEGSLRS